MDALLEEHLKVSFFTATIYQWKHLMKPIKCKQIIVDSLQFLVDKKRIKLYGFVIMPNHIHLLLKVIPPWKLSVVQRDFMKFTGQQIKFDLMAKDADFLRQFEVGLKDRRYQFWQRNSLNILFDDRREWNKNLNTFTIIRFKKSGCWPKVLRSIIFLPIDFMSLRILNLIF